MTTQDFINKYDGKGIDFDNYYGFQCMDLYQQYNKEVVGGNYVPRPTAKDVFTGYPTDYYEKITNSPSNFPQNGDVIIWGVGVGPSGHIAICIDANPNNFTSFDQNWPVGSVCHVQPHNYNGVLGWLRPKKNPNQNQMTIDEATFNSLVAKSTEDDAYRALGYGAPQDVKTKVEDLQNQVEQRDKDNTTLKNHITELNAHIEDLKKQITEAGSTPPETPPPPDIPSPEPGPTAPSSLEKALLTIIEWFKHAVGK